MKNKFTKDDAYAFGWKGLDGLAYSSSDDFDFASVATFDVTGRHGKTKTTVSNRIYYIIKGSGKFIIAGKEIDVAETDTVIVPKNTEYDYSGKMRMFLVHSPAYNLNGEINLETMEGK